MFPLVLAAIDAIEDPNEREFVEKLFYRYANYVYTISKNLLEDHYDADCAVSDVFLKVIKYRDKFFDSEEKKIVNLLRIYTKHACCNIKNHRMKETTIFVENEIALDNGDIVERVVVSNVSIESDYIKKDVVSEIKRCIKELPYPDNNILWLTMFYNYTSKEIGEHYGINPSTVRNIIQRAKKAVAEKLERSGIR